MSGRKVSSVAIVATLAAAGAVAGLALVFVYELTLPRIQAHKAETLRRAILEVLQDPPTYETLYVHAGKLHAQPPTEGCERVYLGRRRDGTVLGFAIAAAEPGFQDVIGLIFGYDPVTRRLLGMRVLESRETPGLGDKIEKDAAFVGQFPGRATPLVGSKRASGPGKIDMITGATISSRAVISIINHALERLGPLLDDYVSEPTR